MKTTQLQLNTMGKTNATLTPGSKVPVGSSGFHPPPAHWEGPSPLFGVETGTGGLTVPSPASGMLEEPAKTGDSSKTRSFTA